jgi:exopolyphosphatase/guanosine-5'-triphosphate,3'-diphosphate pyrophosphatase
MANDAGAVAALDCGTNSTRLLIVGADGEVLEREMRITRLGEAVDATHKLSADAIARTVAVLREYKALMDSHGVVRARLVATSAARDAVNADEFFAVAEESTGVVPELLSGDEEGRLSFIGATASLPVEVRRRRPVLVVDIGGGSTELAAAAASSDSDAGAHRPTAAVVAVSLDIGCVRLTERFFHHDPPLESEVADARRVVDAEVERARSGLPAIGGEAILIGLAGTVSTLAALEIGLVRYERSRIHHAVLSRKQVGIWLERLAAEDSRARAGRPGMLEGRADVIVGGAVVLDAVMAGFGCGECLVSEDDILDGLVASLQ